MKTLRIQTRIESLRKIMLHPLPTRPVDVAVMVRHERVTVAVSHAGKLYTSQVDSSQPYLTGVALSHTFKCLQKLGIVSEAAVKEHDDIVAKEQAATRRRNSARWILDEAATAGLKLSPKQRQQLTASSTKDES